jgi:hypothetical protein
LQRQECISSNNSWSPYCKDRTVSAVTAGRHIRRHTSNTITKVYYEIVKNSNYDDDDDDDDQLLAVNAPDHHLLQNGLSVGSVYNRIPVITLH